MKIIKIQCPTRVKEFYKIDSDTFVSVEEFTNQTELLNNFDDLAEFCDCSALLS